ncbi:Bpu10I family restriction endonuclease [Stutzerimonas balearica]|uniref:Bpu10I family restriction endonuclease n=1 Tax=Stutzerimonas balearica TaxID=74829 RepID=UPI003F769E93
MEQKENHTSKYRDEESRRFLREIRDKYDKWREDNFSLVGPTQEKTNDDGEIIKRRVALFNEYKDFIDQQHYAEKFDSRSNLHSSVLEEFMYYLFKDLVASISQSAMIGKSRTFKDLFFTANSYHDMLDTPTVLVERKDHDFAIGVHVEATFRASGQPQREWSTWDLPAVAVECKTYLDKTMLQDASTASEIIKHRNPNALYIVVAEWLKLTEAVNLRKFKIDQIYVLRKQKNTDREFRYRDGYVKNPIYHDVVEHLFCEVRDFLTKSWEGGVAHGLQNGILL